jgi:hypothetical protein
MQLCVIFFIYLYDINFLPFGKFFPIHSVIFKCMFSKQHSAVGYSASIYCYFSVIKSSITVVLQLNLITGLSTASTDRLTVLPEQLQAASYEEAIKQHSHQHTVLTTHMMRKECSIVRYDSVLEHSCCTANHIFFCYEDFNTTLAYLFFIGK